VYDSGFRLPCSSFVAFCWKSPDPCGPRIGFTATRGLGGAVDRNRMKRRVREALRLRLDELGPNWWVVFNLRRRALDAPRAAVEADLAKVFARCDG
jgi:ribonuclease P protein component